MAAIATYPWVTIATDCAAAIVLLAERLDEAVLRQSGLAPAGWSHVNVGSGEEVTIAEVAEQIAAAVGYQGRLRFDPSKPDGTPRKLVDSSVLRGLGFRPETALREGLAATVQDYRQRTAQQALGGPAETPEKGPAQRPSEA